MTASVLNAAQTKILALNHKFVPRPLLTPPDDVRDAFDNFARRLRLSVDARRYRLDRLIDGTDPDMDRAQPRYIPQFHIPNPTAEGPRLFAHVEVALKTARELLDVEVLDRQVLHVRPNINHSELKKLLKILSENDLIAVPADKNLGLCLVTREWYMLTGWKLVENPSYKEVEPDHELLLATLNRVLCRAEPLLTRQQLKWLRKPVDDQIRKVPILKVIPKIHKLPISGRPIAPSFDTLLANASSWVDHRIKALLPRFQWILPDSKAFCRQLLNVKLEPQTEYWLVSGDVVAMYPNIPIEDGIAQIAKMLGVSTMHFDALADAGELEIESLDDLTILFLRMVLQFNYVSFVDRTFHQVIGTTMGTALAPTYANLFLAGYESIALPKFAAKLPYYGRFIDDTFAIVKGSRSDVQAFQDRFGILHPNMKMEWTQSQFSLPFLDVHVSLDVAPGYLFRSSKVAITTRVYQKPMNAYLYIPWSSCHSDASKSSWVRGELIRYVRISSKVEDFEKIKTSFCKRLRAHGYPGRWLRKVFLGVSYNAERPHALDPHPTDPAPSKTSGGDSQMYVLKLTHNLIWDDFTFGEIWRPLRDAWIETGLGRAEDHFLASFKKSSSLGDGLNASNRRIIEATQATPATEV